MKNLLSLIGVVSVVTVFLTYKAEGMGSKVANSYWTCTFKGMEEYPLQDLDGNQYNELREFLTGSDWFPKRDEAYSAAKEECESYSVKECVLSGCSQKGELR